MKGFNIRDLIGLVLIAAFIGAMGAMFQVAIPEANKDLLTYMLGQLSGFVAGVVAMHYAGKAGEKELDKQRVDNTTLALETIKEAQAAPNAAQAGTPAGTEADPLKTEIVNTPDDPENVKQTKPGKPEGAPKP